ncbi:recombinase family protein [Stenotrophomonas maltophilia]|uniref:recombinase family protein n=1 Tax=Stenotrophomonas maltophilia TaxID=40324 RepID=UPI003BF85D6B
MKKIGYARVSTEDQNLALQLDALRQDGCKRIYQEKITGKAGHRPTLAAALAALSEGDMLVVWKLDRLGRSLKHLIDTVQELEARKIGFRSIADGIDTETPGGRLLFHVIGAIAEFEVRQISERTKAGLLAARSRGARLGRPPVLSPERIAEAQRLCQAGELSRAAIAQRLNIGRTTLWRVMRDVSDCVED